MNATAHVREPVRANARPQGAPRAALARKALPRLAVLPFDNLAADPGASPLADALTILVIANLACRGATGVLSRSSTQRYRGTRAALADIARELDAASIVEGSVLRQGNELLVLVQLVDARTGEPVLTRTYTGQAATIQRIQAEIAWQIAEELAAAVGSA